MDFPARRYKIVFHFEKGEVELVIWYDGQVYHELFTKQVFEKPWK